MAIQRTKGVVALRYCAVVVLMAVTQLVGFWFHSAGVYQGVANVPLSEFPEEVDFVFVLTFAATVLGLKYLVYEFAVKAFTGNYRNPVIRLCYYTGYTAALMIDMASGVETHIRFGLSHSGRSLPNSIGPHRIGGRNRSHCSLERHASQSRGYRGSLIECANRLRAAKPKVCGLPRSSGTAQRRAPVQVGNLSPR
ncbi:MAG: hypothetical protein U1D68_17290 [Arthrobacter sp.]|nr:hypothetical protein [Arthrobacter sp.]MDZ4351795.1 hypothetical protein [Arthrobacter sp.]